MALFGSTSLVATSLLLAFTILFVVAYTRLRRGEPPSNLRPLPGTDSLRALSERAIEEGRAVHLALGSGVVGERATAQTLMGLVVLEHLNAPGRGQPPIVTTADPTAMLLSTANLASRELGDPWRLRGYGRFVAPQPAAYGAGSRTMMQRERLGLTATIGDFGDEYLFLAAAEPSGGEPMYSPEMVATARIETLPLVELTARHALLGEEIFALGAYLERWPSHLASLQMQDVARVLVILAILIGLLLRTAGFI